MDLNSSVLLRSAITMDLREIESLSLGIICPVEFPAILSSEATLI